MENTSLCFLPAHRLARLLRRREIGVTEVAEAYLARIERRNPAIGAYVRVLSEEALERAGELQRELDEDAELGPLHGVPVAIKDLEDVAGVATTFGSRGMLGNVPSEDAILTSRLRRAGALILGKTNAPEFGHKGTTDNLVFGPTNSPFGVDCNAGGSSGGAAAAVADGLVSIAQGGDGGGSIRIPAALCGVYGLKPSWGRVPHSMRPAGFSYSPMISHGPLARTVKDAALMTAVISGPHARDPMSLPDDSLDWEAATEKGVHGLKVAYTPDLGGFPVEKEVAEVVAAAPAAFVEAGAHVERIDLRFGFDHEEICQAWRRSIAVGYAQTMRALRNEGRDLTASGEDGLEPEMLELLDLASRLSAVQFREDDVLRTDVFDRLQDVFAEYDLLVSPTVSVPCVKTAADGLTMGPASVNGVPVDRTIGWALTCPINFTGHPAASVPAGTAAGGSPVGMQIVGRRFADDVVLSASAAFERLRPWSSRYPGLKETRA